MATIELNYDYDNLRTSLRYWLQGRSYYDALKAMELGMRYHTGVRKNGHPEFSHQVFQAQYARTLEPSLLHPQETIAVIFMHDLPEDHGVSIGSIRSEFGLAIAHGVELMTDEDEQGNEKSLESYYGMMVESPLASIAKGVDRIHNLCSMLEVFKPAKQLSYIEETRDYLLPMLKAARKRYPEQELAYQNIKHVLLTHMDLTLMLHSGTLETEFLVPEGTDSGPVAQSG